MRVTELAFGVALQQIDMIVRSGSIDDRNRHVERSATVTEQLRSLKVLRLQQGASFLRRDDLIRRKDNPQVVAGVICNTVRPI